MKKLLKVTVFIPPVGFPFATATGALPSEGTYHSVTSISSDIGDVVGTRVHGSHQRVIRLVVDSRDDVGGPEANFLGSQHHRRSRRLEPVVGVDQVARGRSGRTTRIGHRRLLEELVTGRSWLATDPLGKTDEVRDRQ